MTCRYGETDWLDVLYTSVRNTPGKVAAAAAFLTHRRGRSISTESLRLRLRGEGENRLSMEMFELLIEWMEEQRQPHYRDALIALNERFGLHATPAEGVPAGNTTSAVALHALELARDIGIVAEKVYAALEDDHITTHEADDVVAAARGGKRMLDRLIATVVRVSKKPRGEQ